MRTRCEHLHIEHMSEQEVECIDCGAIATLQWVEEPVEWPVEVEVGVHGSKEAVSEIFYEYFSESGADLDEWEEKNGGEYRYLGYEILMTVEAHEDGSTRITEIEANGTHFVPRGY